MGNPKSIGLDLLLAASLAALLLAVAAPGQRVRRCLAQEISTDVFADRMANVADCARRPQGRGAARSAVS
jgi:hypothetical protein